MQKAFGTRGREVGMQANCAGQLEVPVLGHAAVLFLNGNTLSYYQMSINLRPFSNIESDFFLTSQDSA